MNHILIIVSCILFFSGFYSQNSNEVLDDFESTQGWQNITSDESVKIHTQTVPGKIGNALEIHFDFTKGSGFCGIQKQIPMELPDNFSFSFYLKGDAPVNNFEFKLVDASGDNVWWLNQRNYEFDKQWRRIIIKKRHIQFAWGPTNDKSLRKIDKIQFFIASATGGAGSIYLDDFKFESLSVADTIPPKPVAYVSSEAEPHFASHIFDGDLTKGWRSSTDDPQPEIIVDLKKHYEYGGLIIDWDKDNYAKSYEIYNSHDMKSWQPIYHVTNGKGGRAYIPVKDYESRYLKLKMFKSSRNSFYGIKEISVQDYFFSEKMENVYKEMSKDNPRGYFPRYFYNEQSYWTLTGVNNDQDEALISEDGAVEVDKSMFSIEPFLVIKNNKKKFYTWNDVSTKTKLEKDYLPVPSVEWNSENWTLETKIFADGPPGESVLYTIYSIKNMSAKPVSGSLYLAIRPFQVNPPWQFINWPGGTTKISSVGKKPSKITINGIKDVIPLDKPDNFAAVEFDEGDIIQFISNDKLPTSTEINDSHQYASAAMQYNFKLNPDEKKQVVLAVPFHESDAHVVKREQVSKRLEDVCAFWEKKINTVDFNLPASANHLLNTIRSNLAYILINRDGYGIQPGSRSYERSWIRDGSLTSSALLKLGVKPEVKDFINWYAGYQYPDGKVPCVVDKRGPDPTAENDSHGQLIFAILQYFLFTGDTTFLASHFENVRKAVEYMDKLTAERRTKEYLEGNETQKACYGLLPESISHEGYSAKPMHSYWDDFFGLKGYKDAVQIAKILGKDEQVKNFVSARDTFHNNLYRSIDMAISNKQINFIPGCVELGDFDATSTAIAVYPCNELKNLPEPYAHNTFDRYFEYFEKRRDDKISWKDYTPYEVRLIGTFIYLGQIERAHALIDFFFKDQRPNAWNHWAEVVRPGYRTPGFIGDMPHTWVGSDFISAVRSMFVYEDELNQSLVIGAGLYKEWLRSETGISVKKLPTYYGNLDYAINKIKNGYHIKIAGSLKIPIGKIQLSNFDGKVPKKVIVNGNEIQGFDENKIKIAEFPADVDIIYN